MPYNQTSRISCAIFPIDHPSLPPGLPCQEYKHHTAQSSTSGALQEVVLIESTAGTSFEIHVEIEPTSYSMLRRRPDDPDDRRREDDYLIYVVLDGLQVQRSKRYRTQEGPTRISGVYSQDKRTSRSFQFGKLALVDADDDLLDSAAREALDAELCEDANVLASLGSIEVNVVRCQLGKPRPPFIRPSSAQKANDRSISALRTTNQMKFSERSKKACLSNTAGLSDALPNTCSGAFRSGKKSIRPIDWEDPNPFLQFVFKYKSKALLEAEGIIAPPPPPPPPAPTAALAPRPILVGRQAEPMKPKLKADPGRDECGAGERDLAEWGYDYKSNVELHRDRSRSKRDGTIEEKKPKQECIEIDTDDEDKVTTKCVPKQSSSSSFSSSPGTKPKREMKAKREGSQEKHKKRRKSAMKCESDGVAIHVDDVSSCKHNELDEDRDEEDPVMGHEDHGRRLKKAVVIDLTGDGSDSD